MREKGQPKLMKSVALTLAIGLVASLAVMLLAAWGVSAGQPISMPLASAVACGVGSFIAGMGGIALLRKRALITGIASGLAYFLLIFLFGAIVYFRAIPVSPVVGMLLASLIGGAAAGLLRKKPKHR